jgi:hypothetical protein
MPQSGAVDGRMPVLEMRSPIWLATDDTSHSADARLFFSFLAQTKTSSDCCF